MIEGAGHRPAKLSRWNVEVVRLMDCESEIHSIRFIRDMPKLKVLELGRVRLSDTEGLERLNTLKYLCIW